jgi:hypothetical protein
MEKRQYFRLLYLLFILILFYILGVPIYVIIILASISILIIIFRGRIYKKLENSLEKYFPSTKKWKPWLRKTVIIVAFIIILILIKQIIYFFLRLGGIDIQRIIEESLNKSLEQSNP